MFIILYYISWGKEQSLIFVRKVGGGIKEEVMEKIIELLLEKEFFNKDIYGLNFLPLTIKLFYNTSPICMYIWFFSATSNSPGIIPCAVLMTNNYL